MGLFSGINQFLGTAVGGLTQDILGGLWNDSRKRQNTRKQFEFLQSKGLTPWEIGGGGGGGRAVSASPSMLGNGPAIQAATQRAFQADQADKERANRIAVADIQTGPAHKRADIEGRMEPLRSNQIRETTRRLKVQIARDNIELKNFFPILFAKMGPDNLMMAMSAFIEGVDIEQVLKGTGLPANSRTRQQMEAVAAWVTKYRGLSGGIQGVVKTGTDAAKNAAQNILGAVRNR